MRACRAERTVSWGQRCVSGGGTAGRGGGQTLALWAWLVSGQALEWECWEVREKVPEGGSLQRPLAGGARGGRSGRTAHTRAAQEAEPRRVTSTYHRPCPGTRGLGLACWRPCARRSARCRSVLMGTVESSGAGMVLAEQGRSLRKDRSGAGGPGGRVQERWSLSTLSREQLDPARPCCSPRRRAPSSRSLTQGQSPMFQEHITEREQGWELCHLPS